MKITKKFVKNNVTLTNNSLPGNLFRTSVNQKSLDENFNDEHSQNRLYINLEKWGWIENIGQVILTSLGYENIVQ